MQFFPRNDNVKTPLKRRASSGEDTESATLHKSPTLQSYIFFKMYHDLTYHKTWGLWKVTDVRRSPWWNRVAGKVIPRGIPQNASMEKCRKYLQTLPMDREEHPVTPLRTRQHFTPSTEGRCEKYNGATYFRPHLENQLHRLVLGGTQWFPMWVQHLTKTVSCRGRERVILGSWCVRFTTVLNQRRKQLSTATDTPNTVIIIHIYIS